MKFITTTVLFYWLGTIGIVWPLAAVLGHEHHDDESRYHHKCGAREPTPQEIALHQVRLQAALQQQQDDKDHDRHRRLYTETCDELCNQCIEVQVNLHLVGFSSGDFQLLPHPTDVFNNALDVKEVTNTDFSTREYIEGLFSDNIDVANAAFAGTPFRFRFVPERTTVTYNLQWTLALADYQTEIGDAVGSNDLRQMDVFLGFQMDREDAVTAGLATPGALQRNGSGDGLFQRYDVLTGGGLEDYDLGYTLVHEMGHWFGLFHTFQANVVSDDPCEPAEEDYNDFIQDTPLMSGPSDVILPKQFGVNCTAFLDGSSLPDTCPNLEGFDPLFNYMNYVLDICLAERGEFTCNQIEWMYRHWLLYRDPVSSCADPVNELEIELVAALDSSYLNETGYVVLSDQDGNIIFNSISDHFFWYIGFENATSAFQIDVCVPRSRDYYLYVGEAIGDYIYDDGSLTLYLDGKMEFILQGDFGEGEEFVYTISATPYEAPPTVAPTQSPTLTPTMSGAPSTTIMTVLIAALLSTIIKPFWF